MAKKPKPFSIALHARVGKSFVPFLERQVAKAARIVPRCPRTISIALVGDPQMSELHVRFMNIKGPTDVLTFELDHDARGRCTEGEIVLCVPEARRQSAHHGTDVAHELLLYVIHGLLHLTGHDDHDEGAYRRMHAQEDVILRKLGIGPVFAPTPTLVSPPTRSARVPAPTRRRSSPKRKSPR